MHIIDIVILALVGFGGYFSFKHLCRNKGKCCGSCNGCSLRCDKKHG